jgi:deferrochelatase/peroxidase EfeB
MSPLDRGLLQDGIYIDRGVPPPAAWRAMFLDVAPGTSPAGVRDAVARVWHVLAELRGGRMSDLSGRNDREAAGRVPIDTFTALLGLGASFFDPTRHEPPLTTSPRPAYLVPLTRRTSAFPQLPWAQDGTSGHGGEADLLIQLAGISAHAVDRAAVEVAKAIADGEFPLVTAGTYDGFRRDDGRSWIGFHDGISNIEPSQRLAAIQCAGDPDWNRGGTYLAFLRVEVALAEWRRLDRAVQEVIVGRDKITGCPIESVAVEGIELRPSVRSECPGADGGRWRERDAYFNPPDTSDPLVETSHVHRVNQNRGAGTTPAAHRIFRQGYEYLEDIGPDGPRLGLNFVSFQNDLAHLQQILGLHGWLGDANFGGPVDGLPGLPDPIQLMALRAGGFYAVCPRAEPFPGAHLLATR